MSKERFKLIVDVHLLLIRDGKIVLLKRANTGYEDGKYGLIAGHADGDETATEAMVREAREEAGIEINPSDLEFRLVMHRKTDREQVGFFFTARGYSGVPRNAEPDKCSELDWFDLENLPENIIPYIKKSIELLNSGVNYYEFGWER